LATKDTAAPITTDSVNNLELRSNDIQEFIGHKPNFFTRWGITLFFVILLLCGAACYFIQYPDVVTTKARLNCINAPKEVLAYTSGKLQQILVSNGDSVTAGTTMAIMESIADPAAVYHLKTKTEAIASLIAQNKTDSIIHFFPDYSNRDTLKQLGELQQSFQTFMQAFTAFRDFTVGGFYLRKKKMLETDMTNLERSHGILLQQKNLLQRDLKLSDATFIANESLAKDKVISAMEYRAEQSKLIAKQLSMPQASNAVISNESQQNDKRKEIVELENQFVVQKNNFIQAVQTFTSQIAEWEHKYLLKAPIAGKVAFAGFLQQNQLVKNGELLFYVLPASTSYFAEMLIPQYNFGKVSAGQTVHLKFQAYPFEQFGSVTGKIDFISNAPADSGFLAKVVLPEGLKTNYNKTLRYQYGLYAQADIVTENMNLLQRFFYNIRKQLHH
jgi:HlyD family secretion protein